MQIELVSYGTIMQDKYFFAGILQTSGPYSPGRRSSWKKNDHTALVPTPKLSQRVHRPDLFHVVRPACAQRVHVVTWCQVGDLGELEDVPKIVSI